MYQEKLSQRIKFAVASLIEFEKGENNKVDTSIYHDVLEPTGDSEDKICVACLAGAAALKIHGITREESMLIKDSSDIAELCNVSDHDLALYESSISAAQFGRIDIALEFMGFVEGYGARYNFSMPSYSYDRDLYISKLLEFADTIEKDGL